MSQNDSTPPVGTPGNPYGGPQSGFAGRGTRFFDWMRGLGVVRADGWLGGVCAGIAYRLGIDPLIVRGIVVVAAILGAPVLLLYAAAWALLPDRDGRIHLQALFEGDFEPPIVAIGVMALLSLLPWTSGLWWTHGGFWDVSAWGDVVGRVVWTLVVVGAVVALIVVAVRNADARAAAAGGAAPGGPAPGGPAPGGPAPGVWQATATDAAAGAATDAPADAAPASGPGSGAAFPGAAEDAAADTAADSAPIASAAGDTIRLDVSAEPARPPAPPQGRRPPRWPTGSSGRRSGVPSTPRGSSGSPRTCASSRRNARPSCVRRPPPRAQRRRHAVRRTGLRTLAWAPRSAG
ncbi:PspC domain-containing protein [Leifsonia xyli]|uniref:PspC domain-containing protein n=1 Tax=Leifsonia xyli TaxID=1575 RepID=UPI003D67C329